MLKKSLCLVLGFMCIGDMFGSVSVPLNSLSAEELSILQVMVNKDPKKVKDFIENCKSSGEYKISEDGRTIFPGDSGVSENAFTQPVKKHKRHKKNRKNNVSVTKQAETSINTSPDIKDEKYDLDEVTEQLKKWQEDWVNQRKEIVRALENLKKSPADYFPLSFANNKEYKEKLKSEEKKPDMPMLYWDSLEGDWSFNSESISSCKRTEEELKNIDLSKRSNDYLKNLLDKYNKLWRFLFEPDEYILDVDCNKCTEFINKVQDIIIEKLENNELEKKSKSGMGEDCV